MANVKLPLGGYNNKVLDIPVLDTANGFSVAITGDGSGTTTAIQSGVYVLESDVAARFAYGTSPATHPVRALVGPQGGRSIFVHQAGDLYVEADAAGTLTVIPVLENL